MFHQLRVLAILLALAMIPLSLVMAQSSGSRGGLGEPGSHQNQLPDLDHKVAQRYITIEGSAEVRVAPTEIRVVLAVTDEGKTAQDCQQNIGMKINALKAEWAKMKIAQENIVVDFIAVLPVYEWTIENRGNRDVGVEQKTGYRMQTNVHLAVETESTAQAAIAEAFALGITDIIAFDYWSRELDEIRKSARQKAVNAARDKADVLLGVLFDDRPPVINVQERTTVIYPESLYQSFVNSHEETAITPSRRDVPFIRAYRPRNTYYRGHYHDGDTQAKELPMKPEISVISTVRLYFESPAAKVARSAKD